MAELGLLCRNATPFTETGDLDEDAFRQLLHRFVDAKIGVYLASGGSGEGHALTMAELKRVYEIGVEECKGKIPVYGNPPEHHTVRVTLEHSLLALDAGVEMVNIYPPAGWHGMRAKDPEIVAFYDDLMREIKKPVALSIHPMIGYVPSSALIAGVCRKHRQIAAINLMGLGESYLLDLKDRLGSSVTLHVPLNGCLQAHSLGADGILGAEANVLPKTHRQFLDLFNQRKIEELGVIYQQLARFKKAVNKWEPPNTRWIKMAMKVFDLPGGKGGMREPYRMPPDEEMIQFTKIMVGLGIPEIDEMARTVGLK